MRPGVINGFTHVFGKPVDMSDAECSPLHLRMGNYQGLDSFTSAWFPSPAEMAALNSGAPILLTVIGGGHPPVYLSVGEVEL